MARDKWDIAFIAELGKTTLAEAGRLRAAAAEREANGAMKGSQLPADRREAGFQGEPRRDRGSPHHA